LARSVEAIFDAVAASGRANLGGTMTFHHWSRWSILALAAFLGACATAKLDVTRPIVERGNLVLGKSYEQGGVRLDPADMLKKLEADERTREETQRSKTLAIAGGLLNLGGSAVTGAYLGLWEAGRPANATGLGVGAGLVVAALPISYLAQRSLSRAIDTYNAGLPQPQDADRKGEPEGAPPAPHSLRWTLQAGFDFGFRELAWLVSANGERTSLRLNDGIAARFGIAIPYGAWETELRAGIKTRGLEWKDSASRESELFWFTFPLEALEALNVGPVRIAAGIAFHPVPMLAGAGGAADATVHFDPAMGGVAEIRYQAALAPLRRGAPFSNALGVRYEWLPLSKNGWSTSGSAVGIFTQTAF
jgi:hypothetical protein